MTPPPRWPPFVPSILDDYPLDPYEFRVLCRVARRQSPERGCDESNRRTADECGMSESKVRYAKALLVAAGLLTVSAREGRTNTYRLAPPDGWADPDPEAMSALRRAVRQRRQKTTTAAPGTAAPGTAVQDAGPLGTTDRAPRHQEPDTAAPGADEGSPGKVLPEGDSPNGDGATSLVEKLHRTLGVPLNRQDLIEQVGPRLADGWSPEGLLDHLVTAYEREDDRRGVANPTGLLLTLLGRCPDPAPKGSRPGHTSAAKRWGESMAAALDRDAFTEAADRQYPDNPDARAAAETAYAAAWQERNDPARYLDHGVSAFSETGRF